MSYDKEAIVQYRLERALETLEEAKLLAPDKHWNAVANRLYYACFYVVISLLHKNDFRVKSHTGVRTLFSKEFIFTKKVDKKLGILYGDLFNKRQEGDYEDIRRFTKEEIEPLIPKTKDFIEDIKKLITA